MENLSEPAEKGQPSSDPAQPVHREEAGQSAAIQADPRPAAATADETREAYRGQAPAQPSPEASSTFSPWLIGLIALWALWIWTSSRGKKRRRQEEDRLKSLAKGDRVVTIGRMIATVVAFTDDTVTVLTDPKNGAVMTFERRAIAQIMPRPGEEAPAADKKTES